MSSTPITGAGAEPTSRATRPKRAALSGWIGSALEYYDFALYSLSAALVFPTVFFPSGNPTVALIGSLATYAVGYFARPIGAVVLGAWGDRHGRKNVLVFAMFLMGVSTLPGRRAAHLRAGRGCLAPLLLVVLRVVQGFAVAGELGGASAMIVEHSPDSRRGFFASFSLQGTQAGSILATAALLPLAAFLPDEAFQTWGWRIPFLLSAVVILAGYLIRRRVEEPPAFTAQADTAAKRKLPLHRPAPHAIRGARVKCILMTFTNVIGSATLVFGISYGTAKGYGIGFTTSDMLWVTLDGQHRRGGDHSALRRALRPDRAALVDDLRRTRRRPALRALPVHGRAEKPVPGHRDGHPGAGPAVPDVERHLRDLLPGAVPDARAGDRVRGVAERRPGDRVALPDPVHGHRSPRIDQRAADRSVWSPSVSRWWPRPPPTSRRRPRASRSRISASATRSSSTDREPGPGGRDDRYCFTSRVDPGHLDRYRQRHAAVWPEMLTALRDAGWRNYSLFLSETGLLIGYFEADDKDLARRRWPRPTSTRGGRRRWLNCSPAGDIRMKLHLRARGVQPGRPAPGRRSPGRLPTPDEPPARLNSTDRIKEDR